MSLSLVSALESQKPSKCGYCNEPDCSKSDYIIAHRLTAARYAALLARGWRRCGRLYYQPRMRETCCPLYPIRLDVTAFRESKEHRRVRRHLQRQLAPPADADSAAEGGKVEADASPDSSPPDEAEAGSPAALRAAFLAALQQVAADVAARLGCSERWAPFAAGERQLPLSRCPRRVEDGVWSSALPAALAGGDRELAARLAAELADAVAALLPGELCAVAASGRPLVTLLRPGWSSGEERREEAASSRSSARAAAAAAAAAGSAERARLEAGAKRLQFAIVEPDGSDESFQLYVRYQVAIHGDDASDLKPAGYQRFLVRSTLEREEYDGSEGMPPTGYGTVHMQYRLDGKLVGVSVLDVLPNCLSSVYFFYDPSLSHLQLGKYSALAEIDMLRSWALPSLRHYVMGYYLHHVQKMRYKGAYKPSELLCPETYTWVPLSQAAPLLQRSRYARLAAADVPDSSLSAARLERLAQAVVVVLTSRGRLTALQAGRLLALFADDMPKKAAAMTMLRRIVRGFGEELLPGIAVLADSVGLVDKL